MSQLCAFANVFISLPAGWVDVSDDLPEGTPPTLAKPDGVGALQFSVATYRSGVRPDVGTDRLDELLEEFAATRKLGPATDVERGEVAARYVGATFLNAGNLIRAWYLTNGSDVALVTYVADAAGLDVAGEVTEAGAIVRSIDLG